ncbi:TauD/TfdA dioxygenase family protein [Chromobacterium piscinae]|uniref:TauD/TfdA dioxygenase family protein n=1 Tax=Chromobacterium piscinae TaxID=686831 RepID=UPI00196B90A3|nr:TauD/TfdA family dioxygenase [Chromobacterium piscinae]MBX9296624.1 TauD/TfdA family dioxygenase [Chromobacterium vaccinii]MBX9348550.1 TauD/TfdA family dioxygenase [Chromobacterium vaccinii]MBX9359537.1 TauD/TfdA family dioxygenase [Chromobacterium vaccinii]MCD4504919.1 TauD/TfdA family dioxygenase [Chromobacterium piscinae]MCD5327687.1 TauD/TfdA family dioxygenase [Chromobacterium piscinae]
MIMFNESKQESNTPFNVRRLSRYFVGEVTGVDLSQPLDPSCVAALSNALAEHEVLVFPDQNLSREDLMRFGRYFGELTVHPFAENDEQVPELIVFDNQEGNPPVLTDHWHSDETYRECPPLGTMLYSKVVPEIGGDTCFSSMTAAYDLLSDRMQQFLSGLEAVHDFATFKYLFPNTDEGRRQLRSCEERFPPMNHPVVRVHPVTGKKALFVNPHYTRFIKDMEDRESRALLDTLFRATSVLEYQYRHHWKPNTVVFWDNRSVQHAAVHDYYPQRRFMERVTIKGDRPFSTEPAAKAEELRKFKVAQYDHNDERRSVRQFERDAETAQAS